VLVLLSALLWSLGGVLIKQVQLHPVAIAGYRSLITAVFLSFFLPLRNTRWNRLQMVNALAYAGTVVTFVIANKLTTAANAILLQYTAPIWVAILGLWVLKERAKLLDWLALSVVLAGILLFFKDELSEATKWGDVTALLSGFCFAWFIMLLRKGREHSPLQAVLLGNILTTLLSLPFVLQAFPDMRSLFFLLVLGVVQLGLPYLLYTKAISHVTALESILILCLEPIANPILALLFIGEKPGFWSAIGGAIVLMAVTVRSILMVREKTSVERMLAAELDMIKPEG
jgi:drug/metabolite transporter (DMT)-like permease